MVLATYTNPSNFPAAYNAEESKGPASLPLTVHEKCGPTSWSSRREINSGPTQSTDGSLLDGMGEYLEGRERDTEIWAAARYLHKGK